MWVCVCVCVGVYVYMCVGVRVCERLYLWSLCVWMYLRVCVCARGWICVFVCFPKNMLRLMLRLESKVQIVEAWNRLV